MFKGAIEGGGGKIPRITALPLPRVLILPFVFQIPGRGRSLQQLVYLDVSR